MRGDMDALIQAAAAGRALADIASACGLSISSVQRRLREPEVAQAVQALRDDRRRVMLGQFGTAQSPALVRVLRILDGDDDGLALRAAALIFKMASHLEDMQALTERLAAVEEVAVLGAMPWATDDWSVPQSVPSADENPEPSDSPQATRGETK